MIRALDGAPPGVGVQLRNWFRSLAQSRAGQENIAGLLSKISGARLLGAPAAVRSYEELNVSLSYGDPRLWEGAKALAWRLDTRPSYARELAAIALTDILDPTRAVELYTHAGERVGMEDPVLAAWVDRRRGDHASSRRILDDPHQPIRVRVPILETLISTGAIEDDAARARFRALIDEDPGLWYTRDRYARFLRERGDYRAAVPMIREWLGVGEPASGFDRLNAFNSLTRMHYELGEYEEALRVVALSLPGGQLAPMGLAALTLDRLGRTADAERFARHAVERYPDAAWGRSVLAELLWRHGRYDEVTAVLAARGYAVSEPDWRSQIAPAFLRAFEGRPAEEAIAAFRALYESGRIHPSYLEAIPLRAFANGDPAMAFALHSQLRAEPRSAGSLRLPIRGYSYLKVSEDADEAPDWLRGRIPRARRAEASIMLYDGRQYELVWDFADDLGRGETADFGWLMRAAAAVRLGVENDPHRDELLAHFRRDGGSDYRVMGRYLLGLADQPTVLALATTPKRRCEIAYYIALRAEVEGRLLDAYAWYRIVLETGRISDGEYHWALNALEADRRDGFPAAWESKS